MNSEDKSHNSAQTILQLRAELAESQRQLNKVFKEQQESGKLLIRRDLALSRASEKLKDLDVTKSEFISIAAHQLRTPLAAMKWILSMLINKEFRNEQEADDFAKKAFESCERMIHLVNDLLEVDHIQSGKDQFVFESVSIEPLIRSVLTDLSPAIATKNLNIYDSIEKNSIVEGDKAKLQAVFQNLIENAIKYTPKDGEINISSKIEGKYAEISIRDNGIGVPSDSQKLLFTKFFRAQNAMKVDTVGSGLGLFIVKQIIERHGGKIWFVSGPTGTTFSFSIPLPMSGAKN